MSFDTFMVDDVVIVHAAVVDDPYGNPSQDWGNATRTAIKAWIAQRDRSELTDQGRSGELSDWVVFVRADAPAVPGARDRVEYDGDTFDVVGKPRPGKTPRGLHHIEADLRLVVG